MTPRTPTLRRPGRGALAPLLLALLACGLASACGMGGEPPAAETAAGHAPAPASVPPTDLREAGRLVAQALDTRSFGRLAALVHPEEGVRFSPYAHVDPGEQVTLGPEDLRSAARGETLERTWGRFDGSGEPIELAFREYVDRFVCDAPYLEKGVVAVDERQGRGNTRDNAAAAYPDARIVEYHIPGSDAAGGELAWRSLRMAFEQIEGHWYLVGVIHDQWTI